MTRLCGDTPIACTLPSGHDGNHHDGEGGWTDNGSAKARGSADVAMQEALLEARTERDALYRVVEAARALVESGWYYDQRDALTAAIADLGRRGWGTTAKDGCGSSRTPHDPRVTS